MRGDTEACNSSIRLESEVVYRLEKPRIPREWMNLKGRYAGNSRRRQMLIGHLRRDIKLDDWEMYMRERSDLRVYNRQERKTPKLFPLTGTDAGCDSSSINSKPFGVLVSRFFGAPSGGHIRRHLCDDSVCAYSPSRSTRPQAGRRGFNSNSTAVAWQSIVAMVFPRVQTTYKPDAARFAARSTLMTSAVASGSLYTYIDD
jgi:hypothetical protein